jgi:ABC-2 type transport system permease protein
VPETFAKTAAIFRNDVRVALTYPLSFWGQWISIAAQVVTFYFIARLVGPASLLGVAGHAQTYFEYVAVNMTFMRFQSVAIHGFQDAVRNAQMLGTLEVTLATPTPLSLVVVGSGLFPFAVTLVQITFMLSIAHGLGLRLDHTNLVTALTFITLTVLAVSPIGILSAASIMLFKQGAPTNLLFGGFAALLSGVFIPIDHLPPIARSLSWFVPFTHALNGIRGAVAGASVGDLWGDAVWMAVMTVVLLPLSLYVFARAVHRAKIDGTLGDY